MSTGATTKPTRPSCGICAGVRLIAYDPAEANNYQYVVIEIDERRTGIGRDQLMRILHAENVLAKRYYYPGCHRVEPYRTLDPDAALRSR